MQLTLYYLNIRSDRNTASNVPLTAPTAFTSCLMTTNIKDGGKGAEFLNIIMPNSGSIWKAINTLSLSLSYSCRYRNGNISFLFSEVVTYNKFKNVP
jgi:hypothetical protein